MTLAIRGHATRGKEIIEILEMLGGKNKNSVYSGKDTFHYYYIDNETGNIRTKLYNNGSWDKLTYNIFTLEEYLEKYPYKVGDKALLCGDPIFITKIEWIEWIEGSVACHFYYKGRELMIPSKYLQPYKEPETMEEKIKIDIPKGYEFAGVVNGKVVFEKVKPEYPKTYEECCDVLVNHDRYREIIVSIPGVSYKASLIEYFTKLLICRDAYWKLAGDWKPDWDNNDVVKYTICCVDNNVRRLQARQYNYILAFPTKEMRDAFYENFKDLIEQCKELL